MDILYLFNIYALRYLSAFRYLITYLGIIIFITNIQNIFDINLDFTDIAQCFTCGEHPPQGLVAFIVSILVRLFILLIVSTNKQPGSALL